MDFEHEDVEDIENKDVKDEVEMADKEDVGVDVIKE